MESINVMRSAVSIDNYTKSWKEKVNCALQDAQHLDAVPTYITYSTADHPPHCETARAVKRERYPKREIIG